MTQFGTVIHLEQGTFFSGGRVQCVWPPSGLRRYCLAVVEDMRSNELYMVSVIGAGNSYLVIRLNFDGNRCKLSEILIIQFSRTKTLFVECQAHRQRMHVSTMERTAGNGHATHSHNEQHNRPAIMP